MSTQLAALAKKFPPSLIQQLPGKGWAVDYVSWSSVQEKLLSVLGPVEWRTIDRWEAGDRVFITVELVADVDGKRVTVKATGESDGHDYLTAESRGRCRAAALIGCGLALWSGDKYRLDRALAMGDEAES